jgi:CBS domain-containing protein
MISVGEVMTQKVITLTENDSLYDARQLMQLHNFRHIPILNESGTLVGLVSQRDILAASESSLHATGDEARINLEKQHILKEVMVKQVCFVDERESLRSAAIHMRKHKHGCLLVMKDKMLKGIITETDFVGVAINLMEQIDLSEDILNEDYLDEDPLSDQSTDLDELMEELR